MPVFGKFGSCFKRLGLSGASDQAPLPRSITQLSSHLLSLSRLWCLGEVFRGEVETGHGFPF